MTKPSREYVLKVASACLLGVTLTHNGEPAQFIEGANWTEELERFAAAMYAAGAEDMRERVETSTKKEVLDWEILRDISVARNESALIESSNILAINRLIDAIRDLPISSSTNTFTTNTEGEQHV